MRQTRANRVSRDAGATGGCASHRDQRERIAMAVARAPSSGVSIRRRTAPEPAVDRDLKPANVAPEQPRKVNVVRLRVIGGTVELRDDVPRTTADCPTTRPCPHLKCPHHLWFVDARDLPGKPRQADSKSGLERLRRGRELERAAELLPITMMWPLPPSCALDLIARADGHVLLEDIGRAFGVTRRGAKYLLQKTIRKVKRVAADPELRETVVELLRTEPSSHHVRDP